MSDARDRRRERAAQESKAHPLDVVKRYRVPLVIVLVWLAIVGYQVAAQRGIIGEPGGRCPGHWHAMTDVYLDDGDNATSDELTFDPRVNQAFGDAAGGYHLHDDTGRLHMHPAAVRCIPLGDVYEFLGITLHDDRVDVDVRHNYLTPVLPSYSNNDTHELRVYHMPWNWASQGPGEWRQVGDIEGFMGKQVGNGDKVLVTYVAKDASNATIAAQQDGIGAIGAAYTPQAKSIFMPIVAATIFAGLAFAVWQRMTAAIR
jgi:hypothetical protein